jgi:hypothetical protein
MLVRFMTMGEARVVTVEELLAEGAKLLKAGHADQAIAVWTEVLHLAPGEPRALGYLKSVGVAANDGEDEILTARRYGIGDLEQLLAKKRYEEALEMLYAARREHPEATDLARGVQLLKQRLVRRYLRRLGNLDHVPHVLRLDEESMPVSEEARGLLHLIDGISSFGDIARESRLGRFETYRMLARMVEESVITAAPAHHAAMTHHPEPQPPVPEPAPTRRRGRALVWWVAAVGAAAAAGGAMLLWREWLRDPAAPSARAEPAAPAPSAPAPTTTTQTPPPPPAPEPLAAAAPTAEPPPAEAARPPPTEAAEPPPVEAAKPAPAAEAPVATRPTRTAPPPHGARARELRAQQKKTKPRAAAPTPGPPAPIVVPAATPPPAPPPVEVAQPAPPGPAPAPAELAKAQAPAHVDAPKPEVPTPPAKPSGPLGARVAVAIGDLAGALPRATVERAIDRVVPAFRSCYAESAARAQKNAFGALEVSFSVDETGAARDPEVGAGLFPDLPACVRAAARRIRTEAPDVGGVRVTMRLTFVPLGP